MGIETILLIVGIIAVVGIFVATIKAKTKAPKTGPRPTSHTPPGPN